jgi:hypothetical protein
MDVTNQWDYLARKPYSKFEAVASAAALERQLPKHFWHTQEEAVDSLKVRLVIVRRINPYSPNTHHISFFSDKPIAPSDQLTIVREDDISLCKAQCVLFNSSLFIAQLFLCKEESTGRYLHIRNTDLDAMKLRPHPDAVPALCSVFDKYSTRHFRSLREQFDARFEDRYQEFRERFRLGSTQQKLWTFLDKPVEPSSDRLQLDLDVCGALGVSMSTDDLRHLYEVLVNEMIITKGLIRD